MYNSLEQSKHFLLKEGKEMSNEIEDIVTKSKRYKIIDTVMRAVNYNNLFNSYNNLLGNKATGIDNVTKTMYSENIKENLSNLESKIFSLKYKPFAVKRIYIPKPGTDKKRPLGIPAFEDKIIQDVFAQILNKVYEPMFLDCSYGFRPGRNCHQAIAKLDKCINGKKTNYILDVDIKGFFDNVNHEWLIKFLEYRIGDKLFIRYIKRILKSGMIDDNMYCKTDIGTPQGGIISPILANIYLYFVVDLWFKRHIHVRVVEIIDKLNIILRGYYNYYCITDNIDSVRKFRDIMFKIFYRVMNRRSQKNRYTFKYFYELIENKIIRPEIKVDIVGLSFTMK